MNATFPAHVIGSGVVNAAAVPMADAEPGVTPPPPTQNFIIDNAGNFVIDNSGNRLITA